MHTWSHWSRASFIYLSVGFCLVAPPVAECGSLSPRSVAWGRGGKTGLRGWSNILVNIWATLFVSSAVLMLSWGGMFWQQSVWQAASAREPITKTAGHTVLAPLTGQRQLKKVWNHVVKVKKMLLKFSFLWHFDHLEGSHFFFFLLPPRVNDDSRLLLDLSLLFLSHVQSSYFILTSGF